MKKATKKKSVKASAAKVVKKTAKKTAKKAAAKKTVPKKAKTGRSATFGFAVTGCCTLSGSGPDIQIEGISQEECRRRAIAAGKNDHWVQGKCAQPS